MTAKEGAPALLKAAHDTGGSTGRWPRSGIYVPGGRCVRGNTPNPGHGKADGTGIISRVLLGWDHAHAQTRAPAHTLTLSHARTHTLLLTVSGRDRC